MTLVSQAIVPKRRQVIVLTGAVVTVLIAVLSKGTTVGQLYKDMPWNVIVILVALGMFSRVVARSNVFGTVAVKAAQISKGSEILLLLLFSSAMFFLSCFLNNLTALLLCLPVILTVIESMALSQRFLSICLSLVIVACNLGGAATPIGDFPAILLLGTGVISFQSYLLRAAPICAVLFGLLCLTYYLVYRNVCSHSTRDPGATVALALLAQMYRRTTINWRVLAPASVILGLMFVMWTTSPRSLNLTPDIIAVAGLGLMLLVARRTGEEVARNEVDSESIVFFTSLFLMVLAVSSCGVLEAAADLLLGLSRQPRLMVIIFILVAGILTSLFSAGPAMAACLPVAQRMEPEGCSDALYVALALAVCAGSSLFLTAATSGPLAQNIVERKELITRAGSVGTFSFRDYLVNGVLSFCLIITVAVFYGAVFF